MRSWSGQAFEVWQRVQSDIDLAGGAAELIAPHIFQKLSRQLVFFNELDERQSRINARRNHVAVDFIAILQRHALRAIVFHYDLCNWRFCAYLCAKFARRVRNGVGDGAGASARKSPRAESAVYLSHVVVQ